MQNGAGPGGPTPFRKSVRQRWSFRLSQRSFMRSMKDPPDEPCRGARPDPAAPPARGVFALGAGARPEREQHAGEHHHEAEDPDERHLEHEAQDDDRDPTSAPRTPSVIDVYVGRPWRRVTRATKSESFW